MSEDKYKYERCNICQNWGWIDSHKCPPIWRVWIEDYTGLEEDDASEIYAIDAEEAVLKYVENNYDEDGRDIASGHGSVIVYVEEDGVRKKFKVTGEFNPVYYSEEVED